MSEEKFSWVAIYKEIVEKIKDKTTEDLKNLLSSCEDCQTSYLKKDKGNFINLDYFTFFGSFNRDVRFENRIKILEHLKKELKLKPALATDFDGIPTMNNINSYFYRADNLEKADDLKKLNELFEIAISDDKKNLEDKFNQCLEIDGVAISKLTTGLFWISPENFMPIAGPVQMYLKQKLPNFNYEDEQGVKAWNKVFNNMDWNKYNEVLKFLNNEQNNKKSFKELSLESIESSVENEILENKNVIFHGAPGTGKTYSVLNAIKNLIGKDISRYTLVQFHPSYSYEDFIDGIKPGKEGNSINLKLENGNFKDICIRAFKNLESDEPTKSYFFIADEINRAELSRVFGELLLCLEDDKRLRFKDDKLIGTMVKTQNANLWEKNKHEVVKENGELFFGIPENLYFVGTMNDVDRSVDSFDMALRRRFTWIRMDFNDKPLREKYANDKKLEKYIQICHKLNEYITTDKKGGFNLGVDYQLGQSYFLKPNSLVQDELDIVWNKYIAPLLTEYLRSMLEQHQIPSEIEKAQKEFKLSK